MEGAGPGLPPPVPSAQSTGSSPSIRCSPSPPTPPSRPPIIALADGTSQSVVTLLLLSVDLQALDWTVDSMH